MTFVPLAGRRALALLATVVLALTAAACGAAQPPAATVDGVEISREDLLADLEAEVIASRRAGPDEAGSNPFIDPRGAGRDTYSAAITASKLGDRIIHALIGQELEQRGIEVTDADLEAARGQLCTDPATGQPAAGGACPNLDGYPAPYRDFVIELTARSGALQRAVAASDPDREASARDLYDDLAAEEPEQLEQVCFRPALVPDAAAADQLRAAVAEGQDFATVAAAIPNGQVAPEEQCELASALLTELADAEEGELVGPLDTQQGLFMVLIGERQVAPFEAVAEQLLNQVDQQNQATVREELAGSFADADITVDPRYGRWDADAAQVRPPRGPEDGEGPDAGNGAGGGGRGGEEASEPGAPTPTTAP